MAYTKRIWKGRQGTGLNKFSIDGATPVTVVNQPDSLIEAGDALSAGNLNDLETRIDNAFTSVEAEVATKADGTEVTNLKNAINANSNRISNLEQKAGSYSTVQYRGTNAVPTGKAKYGLVESIVGKSRPWNMLMNPVYASSDTVNGITFTNNGDGSWTISGTASADAFLVLTGNVNASSKYLLGIIGSNNVYVWQFGYNAYKTKSFIIQNNSSSAVFGFYIPNGTVISTPETVYPLLRELNLIFPEGVPSTIAECVQKCPDILKYDAYGYSLVDTEVEGVESKGFNLWDEEWEAGSLNWSTGADDTGTNQIRSKNYIEVSPLTTCYVKIPSGKAIYVFYYDADKNFITYENNSKGNETFTTLANAYYIRFFTASTSYGSIYNHDICINISGSLNGTYKPYHSPSTLSLPSPVTLRSAGSVAEEFDLKTGEKTNTIKTIDLGTDINNWAYDSTYDFFYVSLSDKAYDAEFTCSGYVNVGARTDPQMANVPTMSCSTNGGGWFYIKNTSKNGSDIVGGVCSWLNGVILNYHLLTPNAPTQLTPVIDNTIKTEGGGTVETIQTQTPVIDNCLDVGYLAL